MSGRNKAAERVVVEYREEPIKPVIHMMLVVVAIMTAALAWWNHKIGAEGSKVANTTQYSELVAVVDHDVQTVQSMLDNELVDIDELKAIQAAPAPIMPDLVPVNMVEAEGHDPEIFKPELSGIYWSPHDPMATLNGETYRTGDLILGHRIVEIRKTEVEFDDPSGEKTVVYFYDFPAATKK